jgi:drug/metabolite transporter (DMT)-like permease
VFRENADRRIVLGMAAIVAGAVVLAGGDASGFGGIGPAALVLGACLCWAA